MSLLPKSIHRCRRYPTKFNSGRDIPSYPRVQDNCGPRSRVVHQGSDSSRVASLVGQSDSPISSARADTAYDAGGVYEAIENHSAHRSPRVLIPPRKGALLASGPASSRQRNRNIAAQARLGKRKWHTESGYSKRSKVETTFHRYKAIVGSAMRARGLAAQRVEARIGCKILNTRTALGMPDTEMIG